MRLACLLNSQADGLHVCRFISVCMRRTMWQALCVTSVRPGSSTYRRPTLRAAYVASVWASQSSVPAPLGVEIRQVSKLLMVKWGGIMFCLISRFASVFVQSHCFRKSFQVLNGDCAHVGSRVNLSSHLILPLRCEEWWTGSSSRSPTAATLKLSLTASPRGAPLKSSTAPSLVSPTTSTTGSCLRASEEIRWEENNKAERAGEGRREEKKLWSKARYLGLFLSHAVMPQHVLKWKGCTYPHS